MTMTGNGYHKLTGYERHRISPHFLDWNNAPLQHKQYQPLLTLPLPLAGSIPETDLWDLFPESGPRDSHDGKITLETLATLLALGCGHTSLSWTGIPKGSQRTAPSAGGLYPCDVYAAVRSVPGIEPGLYYCDFNAWALRLISRDHGKLPEPLQPFQTTARSSRDPEIAAPRISLVITGTFFRSSWKYRNRAFRYLLLDCGHILENLVLGARSLDIRSGVFYDFDDAALARYLGIDMAREVCLARVDLVGPGCEIPDTETRNPLRAREIPPPCREIIYSDLSDIYTAGRTIVPPSGNTNPALPFPLRLTNGKQGMHYALPGQGVSSGMHDFVQAVLGRRSRRNYHTGDWTWEPAMDLLRSTAGFGKQGRDQAQRCFPFTATGFFSGGIKGLGRGFYVLDPDGGGFTNIMPGDFTGIMARICLDQEWLKNAALHMVFLADLQGLDAALGPRGYRYAMINAGRLGQRIYLAATALGEGACGIGAFYDTEAADLLSLSRGNAMLYLVAAGPVKGSRQR
ncbi:MAG: SagB family peptide dehydrogenase [Pseudomonadota bacterium]